mmetsp:Transcript_57611/g.178995  ORF Transcript_57611/g.178995 Transcript_57611/m.178995 type:complete len:269 (-) Transcript_57611:639-1445(-)
MAWPAEAPARAAGASRRSAPQAQQSDAGLGRGLWAREQGPQEQRLRGVAAQGLHVLPGQRRSGGRRGARHAGAPGPTSAWGAGRPRLHVPGQRAPELHAAAGRVWRLGRVEPQEALPRCRGGHQAAAREVEGAAVIRVAAQRRQGEAAAGVALALEAELLQRGIDAGAQHLPVVRGEAAHHVQRVCVEGPHGPVRPDGLPEVPYLACVVEGGRRKEVRRPVREAQDVDEVPVQPCEGLQPPARDNIIDAKIKAEATRHEVVVRAIHRK